GFEGLPRRQLGGLTHTHAPRRVDLQLLDLLFNQRSRDIDGVLGIECIENLGPYSVADHIRELPLHAFANLRAQRRDSSLFDTEVTAKFLVDGRERLLLDRLHGERELGRLSNKSWVGGAGREGDGHGTALARNRALEPLLELRPGLARADDDRHILAFATLEGLAADAAGVVNGDTVGIAGRAIDCRKHGPLPAHALEHRIDVALL